MMEWIITASALIITVLLLRAVVRKKISRRLQYALWGLVMIRLLMPFSIVDSQISIMNIVPENPVIELRNFILPTQTKEADIINQVQREDNNQEADEANQVQLENNKQGVIAEDNSKLDTKASDQGELVTSKLHQMTVYECLQLIWITGGVLLGIWFFITNIIFFLSLRKGRMLYEKSSEKLPIYLSEHVVSPCLFGVIHPSIYLTNKAVEEGVCTEHVIRHELSHYRHGDHIWSLMRGICLIIWWWNPLVWIAAILSMKDAEMACDEAVIKQLGEKERLGYGRTLVTMIAIKKNNNILHTATTMTSGKKEIKERLNMIIKNPKVILPVAVVVVFIMLVISVCTFTGVSKAKVPQESMNTDSYNQGSLNNASSQEIPQNNEIITTPTITIEPDTIEPDIIELKALYIKDLYEGGKLFEDPKEEFVNYFKDKVAAMTIPDARKKERATNILEKDDWYKGLIFLNSIPEKNIYLYGYNDAEHFGEGLILDIGEKQHIYSFPYSYMSTTSIAPSIYANEDGSKISVFCHTGSGTGRSISQLYIFQVKDNKVEAFYVDCSKLSDLFNAKLGMKYDKTNKIMTVYSEGKQIATDTVIGNEGTPEGFYCGEFIDYEWNEDVIKVNCIPTINLQNQVGIPSYLVNVSFQADINFEYGNNGKIIGFDIGKIVAVNKLQ